MADNLIWIMGTIIGCIIISISKKIAHKQLQKSSRSMEQEG